jgi:hypothetical protein
MVSLKTISSAGGNLGGIKYRTFHKSMPEKRAEGENVCVHK